MKQIYYHAQVYTGEDSLAQAFLTEDGLFRAVGTDEEILSLADDGTGLHDMDGAFISPGFNDSHMHLLNYGQTLRMAQLHEHTSSLKDMLSYVREFARENPPKDDGWLMGRGWNQDYFSDTDRMPSRWDLDEISTDYPIMMTRACGHSTVVNSALLKLAGISKDTPAPEGGTIGQENGELDGRLFDNAIGLVTPLVPLPDKEELKTMIRLACRKLASYGVTSVQSDDYGVFGQIPFETINEVFRELEEAGELTVRVYEQANPGSLEGLKRLVGSGNVTETGTPLFQIGPLKIVGDGSLGSYTAHLVHPYQDNPATSGFSLYSPEEMNAMIAYANAHKMQVAVHAIGDACLDQVLDAVEETLKENPREDHRHGIVHCQITRPDQLKRIRDLHMHVYAQSIFLDYDNHIVESRVGKELASSSYSWKTLLKEGVTVSNGSDCPVELPDVMRGIQCAVTRTSLDGTGPYLPEEAFTVKEALDSFTISGARASFEENKKGRIAPGFYADFTVLAQNPFKVDPDDLHRIKILACYLAGRRVSS
ncbi:MAG: amidohydrolase [Firmicutes bacterium]|nr:amidohydrolase [Bacillota bacterium]